MRDVHVITSTCALQVFYDSGRATKLVCYRCGEVGHVRSQCLCYKVRHCSAFSLAGQCVAGSSCTFAHGLAELRQPWLLLSERRPPQELQQLPDDDRRDEGGDDADDDPRCEHSGQ